MGKPEEKAKSNPFALGAGVASVIPALRLEVLSNRQAVIDGSCGLIEYSEECIRVSAGGFILRIEGSGMEIRSMDKQGMVIAGRIVSVEYG